MALVSHCDNSRSLLLASCKQAMRQASAMCWCRLTNFLSFCLNGESRSRGPLLKLQSHRRLVLLPQLQWLGKNLDLDQMTMRVRIFLGLLSFLWLTKCFRGSNLNIFPAWKYTFSQQIQINIVQYVFYLQKNVLPLAALFVICFTFESKGDNTANVNWMNIQVPV